MLSVVKMSLKGEVGGHALNSHGNYIVDSGKSWENHGIVFLNFCGNFDICTLFAFRALWMAIMSVYSPTDRQEVVRLTPWRGHHWRKRRVEE